MPDPRRTADSRVIPKPRLQATIHLVPAPHRGPKPGARPLVPKATMVDASTRSRDTKLGFPASTPELERFGFKFSAGGAHISRTMMLVELESVLASVPSRSGDGDYREAIVARNILAKTTGSTRLKSLRHLRELYALSEAVPIFALLRELNAIDPTSLALLALQLAWARDPLLRATTGSVLLATEGTRVETASLSHAVEEAFPDQYSALNRDKIARNAASSWTQSGHLAGRSGKVRSRIEASPVAVTLALLLGDIAGYRGPAVFTNPWCRLLCLTADQARHRAREAHRGGLINLRAIGEVVELGFPRFARFLPEVR